MMKMKAILIGIEKWVCFCEMKMGEIKFRTKVRRGSAFLCTLCGNSRNTIIFRSKNVSLLVMNELRYLCPFPKKEFLLRYAQLF